MAIIIGVTLVTVLVVYLIYSIIEALYLEPARIRQRLNAASQNQSQPQTGSQENPTAVDSFPTISRIVASHSFTDKLLLALTKAGIKLRPSEYIGIVSVIALIAALLVAILFGKVVVMILTMLLVSICILSWTTICLAAVGLTMKGEYALIRERIVKPCLERVARLFSTLLPINTTTINQKLERAGNPWKMQALHFAGLKICSLLMTSGIGIVASISLKEVTTKALLVLCSVVIGYVSSPTRLRTVSQ